MDPLEVFQEICYQEINNFLSVYEWDKINDMVLLIPPIERQYRIIVQNISAAFGLRSVIFNIDEPDLRGLIIGKFKMRTSEYKEKMRAAQAAYTSRPSTSRAFKGNPMASEGSSSGNSSTEHVSQPEPSELSSGITQLYLERRPICGQRYHGNTSAASSSSASTDEKPVLSGVHKVSQRDTRVDHAEETCGISTTPRSIKGNAKMIRGKDIENNTGEFQRQETRSDGRAMDVSQRITRKDNVAEKVIELTESLVNPSAEELRLLKELVHNLEKIRQRSSGPTERDGQNWPSKSSQDVRASYGISTPSQPMPSLQLARSSEFGSSGGVQELSSGLASGVEEWKNTAGSSQKKKTRHVSVPPLQSFEVSPESSSSDDNINVTINYDIPLLTSESSRVESFSGSTPRSQVSSNILQQQQQQEQALDVSENAQVLDVESSSSDDNIIVTINNTIPMLNSESSRVETFSGSTPRSQESSNIPQQQRQQEKALDVSENAQVLDVESSSSDDNIIVIIDNTIPMLKFESSRMETFRGTTPRSQVSSNIPQQQQQQEKALYVEENAQALDVVQRISSDSDSGNSEGIIANREDVSDTECVDANPKKRLFNFIKEDNKKKYSDEETGGECVERELAASTSVALRLPKRRRVGIRRYPYRRPQTFPFPGHFGRYVQREGLTKFIINYDQRAAYPKSTRTIYGYSLYKLKLGCGPFASNWFGTIGEDNSVSVYLNDRIRKYFPDANVMIPSEEMLPYQGRGMSDIAPLLDYVVELYKFDINLNSEDLLNIFKTCSGKTAYLKWLNKRHCLLVLGSVGDAQKAINLQHPLVKARPLTKAGLVATRFLTTFFYTVNPVLHII